MPASGGALSNSRPRVGRCPAAVSRLVRDFDRVLGVLPGVPELLDRFLVIELRPLLVGLSASLRLGTTEARVVGLLTLPAKATGRRNVLCGKTDGSQGKTIRLLSFPSA